MSDLIDKIDFAALETQTASLGEMMDALKESGDISLSGYDALVGIWNLCCAILDWKD